jgi:hypothetical protein
LLYADGYVGYVLISSERASMAVLIVDGGGAAVLRGLKAADSAVCIFWRREGETLGRPAGGAGGGVGSAGAGGSEVKREVRMAESRELRMDILRVVIAG